MKTETHRHLARVKRAALRIAQACDKATDGHADRDTLLESLATIELEMNEIILVEGLAIGGSP